MKKKYDPPETSSMIASEPAVVYGKGINALRQRVVNEVMSLNDVEVLKKVESLIWDLTEPPGKSPVQYTVEELKEVLRMSEEDYRMERYSTWEEFEREMDTW